MAKTIERARNMIDNGEYVDAGKLLATLSVLDSDGPIGLRSLYYQRLGSYYASISNHKLMIESCRKAVALNPRDKDVELNYYNYLGEQAKQCGPPFRLEHVMDYLYTRLRTEPRNPSVWMSILEWQSKDPGTTDGAEKTARQIIKLDLSRGSVAAALNYLGMLQISKGRAADGRVLLEEASRLAPTDPGILVNLGCELSHSDRAAAAKMFRSAAQLSGDNPRAFYGVQIWCHRSGMHELESELVNAKKGPRCARAPAVQIQRAHCLLFQNKIAEAKRVFFQVCARLPVDPELLYSKATFEGDLANFRTAVELATKAKDAVPIDGRYLHTYVNLCQNARQFDQALSALSKLKEIQPENPMVHYQRGHILACRQSLAEAAQEAEVGKQLGLNQSEYEHIYTEIALEINRELSLPRLQKLCGALPLLQQRFPGSKALSKTQNLVAKRVTMVEGKLSCRSVKNQVDANEKSIALDAAGIACLKRGELEGAHKLFKQSISYQPKMKEGYRRLYVAYAKKGDINKAIEIASELLSYGPDESTFKERSVYYLINFQEELALRDIMKLRNNNFSLAMAYSRAVPLADDNKWQMIRGMVNAHARQYVFFAHEREGKLGDAKTAGEKAIIHEQVADAYWSARNFRQALSHSDNAIEYGAKSYRVHAIRAAALKELGRDDEARTERKLTIDLYFENRHGLRATN